jgi:hypothetical protein
MGDSIPMATLKVHHVHHYNGCSHLAIPYSSASLAPSLHVILDKFLGVFFQDLIDFIDQGIHVVLELFALCSQVAGRSCSGVGGWLARPPGLFLSVSFP